MNTLCQVKEVSHKRTNSVIPFNEIPVDRAHIGSR